jgi:hypothetical protein
VVKLWDPQTKRLCHIGSYASEEDTARAYDRAAVQAHGPDTKLNFPGEDIKTWRQQDIALLKELVAVAAMLGQQQGTCGCLWPSFH